MLGHPRNNFTYLGPSDIGTWAHHAKQAQFGKTSGFEKPVTRRRKGNPRNYFFGGILGFFSRKGFSQKPNTITFVTENLKQCRRDLGSIQENAHENNFKEVHKTTENSSGSHMQEIVFFLNSFFKNSLLQTERWRGEEGFMIDAMHKHDENNQSRRWYLPRSQQAGRSWEGLGPKVLEAWEFEGFKALRKWQKVWRIFEV